MNNVITKQEFLNRKDERGEAQMFLASRKEKTIPFKGKETSIYEEAIPTEQLKAYAKEVKAAEEAKAGIFKKTKETEVDRLLDIKSDKEFRDPKTESGEKILQPGRKV